MKLSCKRMKLKLIQITDRFSYLLYSLVAFRKTLSDF